ncbi:MAG: PrsW family intramembrane metalloprotease [Woeseiaceae bacterium]|nr:PrsW family intramembrane metalloprotease [Woeseiaceae bacterium]
MQPFLAVLPVVIPVIFWAGYHYHKDRYLPEPPLNLALCFGLGVGAAILSKWIYLWLEPLGMRYDAISLASDNPLGLLAYALLVIGPIEEFAKLVPFLVFVLHFRSLDEPLDGIIYASFLGLGFAAAENVYYLDYLTPLESAARGFASPVVHILFASIWAHRITQAKLNQKSISRAVVPGFLLAALLHGLYDFLVLLTPIAALPIAATLIIVIWIWRLILMRRLHREAVGSSQTF